MSFFFLVMPVNNPLTYLVNGLWYRFSSFPFVFQHIGGPIGAGGRNECIKSEQLCVRDNVVNGKPHLLIHAVSGYVSTLYIAEYPGKNKRLLLLDTGSASDQLRLSFYLRYIIRKPTQSHWREVNTKPVYCMGDRSLVNESLADYSLTALDHMVSTHAHPDHSGLVPHAVSSGIPVSGPFGICSYLAGSRGTLRHVFEKTGAHFVAWRSGRHTCELTPVHKCQTLTNEWDHVHTQELFSIKGFEDWVCIPVPGHTLHMHALFHPGSSILYASDLILRISRSVRLLGNRSTRVSADDPQRPAALANARITLSSRSLLAFKPPLPLNDVQSYLETLEAFRGFPVKWLLLAHHGMVDVSEPNVWEAILDRLKEQVVLSDTKHRIWIKGYERIHKLITDEGKPIPNKTQNALFNSTKILQEAKDLFELGNNNNMCFKHIIP